jgi:phage terminase large subunit-like protein
MSASVDHLRRELAQRELCRRRLLAYMLRVDHTFVSGDVFELVTANLEWFEHEVLAKRSPRLIINEPVRHGKLCANSTPVWTTQGIKRHGDLQVGDRVFGSNGLPTPVVGTSEEAEADWVVTFNDGSEVRCHGRHEWTVYSRTDRRMMTRETQWFVGTNRRGRRRTLYRMYGGQRRYQYLLPNLEGPLEMPEVDLPVHPYVLGVWLGDGSQHAPVICFDPRRSEHIDKLGELGVPCTKMHPHSNDPQYTNVWYARFGKGALMPHLRALGVLGNKHIPEAYEYASAKQRLELVAGLVDTDGHVDKKGRVVFSNTNKRLITSLFRILQSLNMRPYWFTPQEPCTSSSGITGKHTVYAFGFHPSIPLPTVVKPTLRLVRQSRMSITDVRYAPCSPPVMGKCIQVANADGLYALNERPLLTHNSMTVSQRFPEWLLGRNPTWHLVIASYSADLPEGFSRSIRSTVRDNPDYRVLFPHVELARDSTSVKHWHTTAGGSFKAVGRGGPISGFGADVLIIDDIIKDAEEADSPAVRASAWDWLTSTALSRLAPGAGALQMQTRWNMEDPCGKTVDTQRQLEHDLQEAIDVARDNGDDPTPFQEELDNLDRWRRLVLPGLAKHDEYIKDDGITLTSEPTGHLFRKQGEALHPERWPRGRLLRLKNTMTPRHYAALIEQSPIPEGGRFFEDKLFKHGPIPPLNTLQLVMAADTSASTSASADEAAFAIIGVHKSGHYYVVYGEKARMTTGEFVERFLDLWTRFERHLIVAGIEHGPIYLAFKPLLERRMEERRVYPHLADRKEMTPFNSKEIRAKPLQGEMERGMVVFPPLTHAKWVDEAVASMKTFGVVSSGDDFTDALAWAMRLALKRPSALRDSKRKPKSWRDRLSGYMKAPTSQDHMAA